jgi:hypothetical protein
MHWSTVRIEAQRATAEGPALRRIRLLWRAERRNAFRCQVITAAIYKHPVGQELRVFLEPEDQHDLLMSEVEGMNLCALDERAARLREVLLESGWTDQSLAPSSPTSESGQ